MANEVKLEKYLASVLAAEIGFNAQPEFLKAKAIICRTYAIGSPNRHSTDGYLLCSEVHCQVYKGNKDITSQIIHALKATEGQIITDSLKNPIIAAFHSNCGGKTQNSEVGWTTSLPYLRSVTDTFCLNQPHAKWEVTIPFNKWNAYIASSSQNFNDSSITKSLNGTVEDPFSLERQKYFTYKGKQILTKKLRLDWKFKSSWFTITEQKDSILVQGRGYGHGIGLCQEGAMHMAELDLTHEEIIHFYYTGVLIGNR